MANRIRTGIIGGAGYTGGELIRILLNHPNAEMVFVQSMSNAGNRLGSVHRDLEGETSLVFVSEPDQDIDVLFLCLGHGEARNFLENNPINERIRIIDLSQDFRLMGSNEFKNRHFVYGLPELNKEQIIAAENIANPGCFATAIQLGLLPLAKEGLLDAVFTTGITGSTGAGQSLSPSSHFSWRANNIQAYKTLEHQHNAEILQSIRSVQSNHSIEDAQFSFVPWRGDFTRGIFISSQTRYDRGIGEIYELFEEFYSTHPFIIVSKEQIFLKQVVNTNKCLIQLEQVGNRLVIHTVIDNLLKGASGQAVQNMNLMFGLEETTGLKFKANYF